MKIQYEALRLRGSTLAIIHTANEFITDYQSQGYDLTLRQLYYLFIAKDRFPEDWIDRDYNLKHGLDPDTKNTLKNYKRLGGIISDGRRAGLISWEAIVDRTRYIRSVGSWESPAEIIRNCAGGYQIDLWEDQPYYVGSMV
jgi:hypothetical protein